MTNLQNLKIGDFVDLVDFNGRPAGRTAPPDKSDDARWYCAVVKPNQHGRAAGGLYDAGFPSFIPKTRRWVSHARVRKAKEFPLLGRYIMVLAEPTDADHSAICAVDGIDELIGNLGRPSPFPTSWVVSFRERYLSGEWDFVRTDVPCPERTKDGRTTWRTNPPMPIGARIKIIEGEFEDMLATVTNWNGSKVTIQVLASRETKTVSHHKVRAA